VAIEFSCPHCHHVLRTGDDKAGLSAKCPACNEIIWVPLAGQASAEPPPSEGGGYALSAEPPPDPSVDKTLEGSAEREIPKRRAAPQVKCPNCLAPNDATAQACRYCGTSLTGAEPIVESLPPVRKPDVGEALSTAWRVYQNNIGLLIGVFLITLPLGLLALAIGLAPAFLLAAIAGEADGDMAPVGFVGGMVCTIPLLIVLGVPLVIGVTHFQLKIARGIPASLGDLTYGFGPEGRTLIPGMFVIVLVSGIAGLTILGSIFVWPLALFYVHERKPLGDTFSRFFNRLGDEIGFVLLIGLIIYGISATVSVLIYPCCIGILMLPFIAPFLSVLAAVGYLRLVGERTAFD
jgi:hypothetical protein